MARCDSYTRGQCTWGACELFAWVPEGLGDGGDWAADAAARGYQVTMVPTVGAVVCYCRGGGYSEFGHVGGVIDVAASGQFLVREMNFTAAYVQDDRWSSMADVCGFILPPGVRPGQPAPGQGAGGGGTTPGVPQAAIQAWEQVRSWTRDLSNDQVGHLLGVMATADLIGA